MKKMTVFLLILTICLILFPTPVMAENNPLIFSLTEQNIVLPDSDVELISAGKGVLYAVVNQQGKYYLFRSETKGQSWQKILAQGLPDTERFITLKTIFEQPQTVILATKNSVFLSRDGGAHIESLGGPSGLSQRGEEIASLAVAAGNNPLILVGIRQPAQGKFAEDGVYLWGASGSQWEPQGMRLSWQGKGFSSDVTSVAFGPSGTMIALATGDPDGTGPLIEGSYLNIAFPRQGTQGTIFGADWNPPLPFPGWPIKVSGITEAEIASSKIAYSEFDYSESKVYILFNTVQALKDDVYLVRLGERYSPMVDSRKLEVPKNQGQVLNTLAYYGNPVSTLVVGATTTRGVVAYSLSANNERTVPPYWESSWMKADTSDCQVAIDSSGAIFAGASGPGSAFSQSEQGVLIPVALMDATGGIQYLLPSQNFLKDRNLFVNYGNKHILRLKLDDNYRLVEVRRFLYVPQASGALRVVVSDQALFIFEAGTKRFWLSRNKGLTWLEMPSNIEMISPAVINNEVWCAGKDGMLYQLNEGSIVKRISSGFVWIGRIEAGPGENILVAGGNREGFFEGLSLVNGDHYDPLPYFPTAVSSDLKIAYSQRDNAIYYSVSNQLYRLVLGGTSWERMNDLSWWPSELFSSSQGLYLVQSAVYFSPFPLTKDSKWKQVEGLGGSWAGCRLISSEEKKDRLVVWGGSKIAIFLYQIIPAPIPTTLAPTTPTVPTTPITPAKPTTPTTSVTPTTPITPTTPASTPPKTITPKPTTPTPATPKGMTPTIPLPRKTEPSVYPGVWVGLAISYIFVFLIGFFAGRKK